MLYAVAVYSPPIADDRLFVYDRRFYEQLPSLLPQPEAPPTTTRKKGVTTVRLYLSEIPDIS